ncbi:hypothetical protein PKB_5010 [Pseudomonas knackmussii B13]|uniref:Peptidase S74 domain-containing protein n=1 Tax=Pseudomonas knackmussii (strain DSM 6978 / CCUG 54928 / LMG 23759 / B13) TaxID=1301098 RepID=A0A024HPH3_PSEKB|nr:tail fiber domain-containing protein [Pseudomonas knackmussii]CDF86323.1 hypothetical protein PKB_5010 [Pseudomonas knackmussii B13]
MADTFIPVRLSYTGSAVTAIAEYQPGETMQHPGNLNFSGSGRRITGDFSSPAGSVANRTWFQSNVTNGQTMLPVLPNGTSSISGMQLFGATDPENTSIGILQNNGVYVQIMVNATGTGTQLPLLFGTANTERMRFDPSGGWYVGSSSSDPIGTQTVGMYRGAAGTLSAYATGSGPLRLGVASGNQTLETFISNGATTVGTITTNGTTTAYNTSSDYRLKDQVADIDPQAAEARVLAYRPATWIWKSNGQPGKGFIAHEAQAVDPDVATGTKDQVQRVGNIRAANYTLLAERVEEPADLTPYGEDAAWSFTEEVPVYQGMDASFMIADMVAMLQKMRRELDETKAALRALQGA